ncbi:MAG: hypothetical protein GF384_03400 [Elusimicrobia bacterium]|nr:hypothetical protein [Elusimicrobiota bacterium]MBD3411964.1 hypothetical protein [Elusimicrobiota bacterium]
MIIIICLIVSIPFISYGLNRRVPFPFPSFDQMPEQEIHLIDLGCLVMGMRRIAADIAWINLLHYYARQQMSKTDELEIAFKPFISKFEKKDHAEDKEHDKEHQHAHKKHDGDAHPPHDGCTECAQGVGHWHGDHYHPAWNTRTGFPDLYVKTLRVINLDPYFHYAYLYSAGALAWNLDRFDDAYKLLSKGIENDPSYGQFAVYMSAILFKEKGDTEKMIQTLEQVVTFDDCPNLVKSILANYYEKQGNYYKSLALWINIFETNDEQYVNRAREQIDELVPHMNVQQLVDLNLINLNEINDNIPRK